MDHGTEVEHLSFFELRTLLRTVLNSVYRNLAILGLGLHYQFKPSNKEIKQYL